MMQLAKGHGRLFWILKDISEAFGSRGGGGGGGGNVYFEYAHSV